MLKQVVTFIAGVVAFLPLAGEASDRLKQMDSSRSAVESAAAPFEDPEFDSIAYLRNRGQFKDLMDRADDQYAKWLHSLPPEAAMKRLSEMLIAAGYRVFRDRGPDGQSLDYGVVCALNDKKAVRGCIIPDPAPLKPGGFSPVDHSTAEESAWSCGATYSPAARIPVGRFDD